MPIPGPVDSLAISEFVLEQSVEDSARNPLNELTESAEPGSKPGNTALTEWIRERTTPRGRSRTSDHGGLRASRRVATLPKSPRENGKQFETTRASEQ